MYMFKYICKRIGLMLMTFTIIFTICFVLIKLLPIELGMKEPWGLRGFPSPVSPDLVFENLQRVCKPFGTELKINGDTIDVIL